MIILHLLIYRHHHVIQLITSQTADQGGKCQTLHLMKTCLQASWLSLAGLGYEKKISIKPLKDILLYFIPES